MPEKQPNPFFDLILKKHGGKTVTLGSTAFLLLAWVGQTTEVINVPVPATRAYVDETVGEKTKGLDYLVRKELEHDLDVLHYATNCMRNGLTAGALRRLEEQYVEYFEQRYTHRPCEALELDRTIVQEASAK